MRAAFSLRRLTPMEGHWFFGYYDHSDISPDGRHLLAHRTGFHDRSPRPGDVADIMILDLRAESFRQAARTLAWNFQQGSMLQWLPDTSGRFIYNQWRDGVYGAVVQSPDGREQLLPRPVAALSPDGGYALSTSFTRMRDFRPVCGYPFGEDPFRNQACPEDDGIFLMDMRTGESSLALSYPQMRALAGEPEAGGRAKLCVNHLSFNTRGSRFVCLVRNFPAPGSGWKSALITANIDGSEPYLLLGWSYASHYHWKDERVLALYGTLPGENTPQLYELTDRTQKARAIDEAFFTFDGHVSYSADRKTLLYDSYPTRSDPHRKLIFYDLAAGKGELAGRFYSDPMIDGDIRCDLHPRWSPDGCAVTFDSIHEGFRGIYSMNAR
ncbi:MAG: hypothetical protein LBS36_08420 [Oscillospiraceae bacterium]|jgi:hypothetical protein|nr:hypothetical protein [Oscillospiraceae bacterium]